jgi:hypothetical protein
VEGSHKLRWATAWPDPATGSRNPERGLKGGVQRPVPAVAPPLARGIGGATAYIPPSETGAHRCHRFLRTPRPHSQVWALCSAFHAVQSARGNRRAASAYPVVMPWLALVDDLSPPAALRDVTGLWCSDKSGGWRLDSAGGGC